MRARIEREELHLVGVVHHRRHVGRCECRRVMGFEVCGLIGHERIRCSVRLVEPVARELLHQAEKLVPLALAHAVSGGARDEYPAMLRHLLRQLLAHRAPQKIGAAQGIATDQLRDLHHLLLVHHHAIGRAENGLEARIGVLHALPAVLAVDKIGDEVHRSRPIERDESDEVLETVRPGALEEISHPARFKLEDAGCIARGEQSVSCRVIQRKKAQVQRCGGGALRFPHPADVLKRPIENRQGGETEKVEFHESDGLDILHVELRHHALRTVGGVERTEISQFSGRNQHPARMHAHIAGKPLERLGKREQLAHLLLIALALRELRLHLARVGKRDMPARLKRDELRELVAKVVTQVQDAAHVPHHRLGRHRPERCDLRDTVRAVLAFHVVDHTVASVLAEIDIEVRHRDALGIEETLE